MNFVELLRSEKLPSAAALRHAVEQAEAEAEAITAKLADVTRRREDELLNGSHDATLDALDDEIKRLGRSQDRNDLTTHQLRAKLEQAEAAERQAESEAIRSEALKARDNGLALIERIALSLPSWSR
jgi:ABC-type transporter Mla subunit MlaD